MRVCTGQQVVGVVLGLFAGLGAAVVFLLTAGKWIVLSAHYEWCHAEICSGGLFYGSYAVVLTGCLIAGALAFRVVQRLIIYRKR